MNQFFKSTFIITFLLSASLVRAQKVRILDHNKEAIVGAVLILHPGDSQKQQVFKSDVNGFIQLGLSSKALPTPYQVRFFGFYRETGSIASHQFLEIKMRPKSANLNQVVITGQIGSRRAEESMHKIRVINRERIDNQGAVNLKDVLSNELNIRLAQDGILGSSASVQGVSGENLKVMIDGVPIIGRVNGNIDLSQINLSDIERIEIIEGPMSVSYGSDALAGTINLISKKNARKKTAASINSYFESVGQYNLDVTLSRRVKKNTFKVNAGRYFFDGWSPTDGIFDLPKKKLADTNRAQQWNPKEQYFAGLNHIYKAKQFSLRTYANYYHETILNRGRPRAPYYENAFDDFYRTNRTDGGVDLFYRLNSDKNIKIIAAVNDFTRTKNTWYKNLVTMNSELAQSPGAQDTSSFRTYMSRGQLNKLATKGIEYQLGYDANHSLGTGRRIKESRQTQTDIAAFGSLHWLTKSGLRIKSGLRLIYNSSYRAPIVPSLNVRYDLDNFVFRASYARGFRAPSLKELYFEFVDINHNILGSEDLKAETSNNYQFNIDYNFKGEAIVQKVEFSSFYNQIRNLITLGNVSNSTLFTYVNIGDYKSLGLRLSTTMARKGFDAQLGLAYIGRSNQNAQENGIPAFNFTPELRANLNYDVSQKRLLFLTLFYKYTGRLNQFYLDANQDIQQSQVQDYHMLDLSARKIFWKNKLQVVLGCKNLLGIQNINTIGVGGNAVHSSAVGSVPISWGRTYFTSLKIML